MSSIGQTLVGEKRDEREQLTTLTIIRLVSGYRKRYRKIIREETDHQEYGPIRTVARLACRPSSGLAVQQNRAFRTGAGRDGMVFDAFSDRRSTQLFGKSGRFHQPPPRA